MLLYFVLFETLLEIASGEQFRKFRPGPGGHFFRGAADLANLLYFQLREGPERAHAPTRAHTLEKQNPTLKGGGEKQKMQLLINQSYQT